ncbi:MAG: 30S ribosomal protein S20 [Candidatus Berkelbacteria bacterium]
MPITSSAKKALRSSIKKHQDNALTKAKVKESTKGVRLAVQKGDKKVDELLSKTYRELDLAAKKNVIHKNKASRLKSRLTKLVTKK